MKARIVPRTSIRRRRPGRARCERAARTSPSRATIPSRSGSAASPQRSTASAMTPGDPGEGDRAGQERRHRGLVGGVEDRPAVAARGRRGADGVVRGIAPGGERLELQGSPVLRPGVARRRRQAQRVGQRVLDREAHVGEPELGLERAVGELDERVHHALGVDHGLNPIVRQAVQPFGLDRLERLVDERGRVDRDLGAHLPGRVRECLGRCHVLQLAAGSVPERDHPMR